VNGWDQRLRSTRLDFIDRLERHGFTRATENIWRGTITTSSGTSRKVEVSIGDSWPYLPPIVLPLDNEHADSWHSTRTGGLCLYIDEDRTERPWLDADSLLARITGWFDEAEAGWPNDTPDLDLDRYFDQASPRLLVLYDDLEPLLDRSIRTRRGRNNTVEVVGAGRASAKAKRRELRFGYCADIGTPAKPPKRWSDLEPLIQDGGTVAKSIRDGRYRLLLLRYRRTGREGVVALAASADKDDEIILRAHLSAGTSSAVRRLRAGPNAGVLAAKNVAVVGCGAVGSFVAEGLARAGLGSLTLQDGDVLRPGNLVRHIATDSEVGLVKPEAVRQALETRGLLVRGNCHTINQSLIEPSAAGELLDRHDLVIDASADGAVTTLIKHAAEDRAAVVLSVCTQNDGDSVRVDVMPPLAGATPLPETTQREPEQPEIYEGGCGSPVSPTPPFAVAEAAALAVRHACALLLGAPLDSAGAAHQYSPRPDDD
jgi:hypothetical protein